jgi:hypothetical protein
VIRSGARSVGALPEIAKVNELEHRVGKRGDGDDDQDDPLSGLQFTPQANDADDCQHEDGDDDDHWRRFYASVGEACFPHPTRRCNVSPYTARTLFKTMTVTAAVRAALISAAMVIASATSASAQATAIVVRVAADDDGSTFRYAQVFHEIGDWVAADVGYIDYGNTAYRELFAGFGRKLLKKPTLMILGELYYLQAAGSASAGEKYILPWVLTAFSLTPRIRGEAVYFPYLPLTGSATLQHVVERAKLEYAWSRVKIGGGYGAYQFSGTDWQHKPFATLTVTPPAVGDIEFWVQRVPRGGVQLQVRYFHVIK